jgi:hypothetical protein
VLLPTFAFLCVMFKMTTLSRVWLLFLELVRLVCAFYVFCQREVLVLSHARAHGRVGHRFGLVWNRAQIPEPIGPTGVNSKSISNYFLLDFFPIFGFKRAQTFQLNPPVWSLNIHGTGYTFSTCGPPKADLNIIFFGSGGFK